MLPSMNEYKTMTEPSPKGASYKKTTFFRTTPYSLCHLPLSYSFMEGINDAPLHE
jgi:hypothetical protein